MATIIEYQDAFGESISQLETRMSDEYTRIEKINDFVKKEETFIKGRIAVVDYVKDSDENIDDILSQYPADIPLHITTHFDLSGIYKMGHTESYINGDRYAKGKFVLDDQGNIIFSQKIDLNTNVPILSSVKKWLNFNADEYYQFSYNNNGDIAGMYSTRDVNYGTWSKEDLKDGVLHGFHWFEVGNYYLKVNPEIPDECVD